MKKMKASARKKPARKKAGKNQYFTQKYLFILALILVLILISVIRLRLLNIPLERDEGEYAYFGQLLLEGIPPYEMAYSMKFPGVYFIYAFFMLVFGQSVVAIHLGLLIAVIITMVFLYLMVRELIGDFTGLVAAVTYGTLTLNDAMLGFAAHATHFVVMAAIPGLYYLLRGFKSFKPKYFLISGLLLGLAPIFKQSGVFFGVLGLAAFFTFWPASEKQPLKNLLRFFGWFIAGGLIPSGTLVIYLLANGVWDNFWYWTIQYPFTYGGQVSFDRGMDYLAEHFGGILSGFGLLWVLIGAGIPLMFFSAYKSNRKPAIFFLLAFFILSVLTIVPGFYFRHHYFVSLMPVMAVFAALSLNYLADIKLVPMKSALKRVLLFFLLIVAVGWGMAQNKAYYFSEEPDDVSRRIYGLNPFVESEAIGDFIRRKTKPDDRIVVFGSEPQIYFFAKRQSATGFIYMYPMMELHEFNLDMQEQMIQEIEAADPEILVFIDINSSWLKKSKSPTKIFSWSIQKSKSEDYKLIGTVELFSDATLYKFTAVAMKNQPESKYRVRIYRKIPEKL